MRRALLPLALAPLALGAPALAPGGAARAQVPVGPQLSATVSQRVEVDSNLGLDDPSPGTSTFTETRLNLGLLEESLDQRFTLGFDTGLRAIWPADDDFEFTVASPSTASAGYAREWASGSFTADGRYRQRRVDFTRALDFTDPGVVIPDDPADLEGEAIERRYDATLGLALATDAPSSYAFSLSASRTDYSEDEADLTPRNTVQGTATWRLQLTPLFSGTLSTRGYYYEADNPADTRIQEGEVDAGIVYEPSEVLQLNAGVGYVVRERRETLAAGAGPRVTTSDSGLAFRAGANYAFEDFTVGAGLRVATAPDTRVAGNLNVNYPLPNGAATARVFQSFAGGVGGDEIRVTGAGIGLRQEIDAFSRVNFDLAGSRRVNVDDPADPDVDRVDFTTSFGYDLTEAVTANIGYRFRWREEGALSADSHAVFFQIGRTFVTGF